MNEELKFVRFRRDTAANWASVNPVLRDGEPAWETDTEKMKVGDGVTRYNALRYFEGDLTAVREAARQANTAAGDARAAAAEAATATTEANEAAALARTKAAELITAAETARTKGDEAMAAAQEADRQTQRSSSAEAERVRAEQGRATNETARMEQEALRMEQERTRISAEQTRAQQEGVRQQNETNRGRTEETRVTNEQTRQRNETSRTNAEGERVTAEAARETAEAARQRNETNRSTAESTRATDEATRQTNERTRQEQEASRQQAEQGRATAMANKVDKDGDEIDVVAKAIAEVYAIANATAERLSRFLEGREVAPNIKAERIDAHGEGAVGNFLTIGHGAPTHIAAEVGFLYIDADNGKIYTAKSNTTATWAEYWDADKATAELNTKANTSDVTAWLADKADKTGAEITSKTDKDGDEMNVIAKALADVFARVAAVEKHYSDLVTGRELAAGIRAESFDLHNPSGCNFLVIGEGAPTHIANEAGYLYIDRAAGVVYVAKSNTSPSWEPQK